MQISASKTAVEPKSFNFKGLSPIKRVKTGSLYKYFLGNASNYEQAKNLQKLEPCAISVKLSIAHYNFEEVCHSKKEVLNGMIGLVLLKNLFIQR